MHLIKNTWVLLYTAIGLHILHNYYYVILCNVSELLYNIMCADDTMTVLMSDNELKIKLLILNYVYFNL